MERLTIKTPKGAALNMADEYPDEAAIREDLMRRYRVAVDRLAAYEDTGLMPDQIKRMVEPEPTTPLTLEELRKMDWEPVYIRRINDSHIESGWALVHMEWCGCKTASGCVAFFDRYGEWWLAYRRKPEEGLS